MAAIGSGARTLVRRQTATPTHPLERDRSAEPSWVFGDLLIRRYRKSDQAAVLHLHREGLARIGLRPGDGVYYEHDLHQLEEVYLSAGTGEFVIGERDGQRVAMGGLRRVDDVTGELVRMRVRPDMQRLGYGTAILLVIEERARELGYRTMAADTTEFQGPALELYFRHGYRETHRRVISGIINIYIEKQL